MKAKDSPFKQVIFRLNQTVYLWGEGWVIIKEMQIEWEEQVKELLGKLNLKLAPHNPVYGECVEGFNSAGESMYMHPMEFTGYLHEDSIKHFETLIKEFKSKFWMLGETKVFNLEDESNRYGWIGTIEKNKKKYLELSK